MSAPLDEEPVFLVTELWTIPGTFELFKQYRMKVLRILEPFSPEYVFYSHPFEWVSSNDDANFPSGMEVCRFKNEGTARAALTALEESGIRNEEKSVFSKVRAYLSCHSLPDKKVFTPPG